MRVFLLLAIIALLAGCRNQADSGDELSYLRVNPDDYSAPLSTENLFPVKPGTRWEYAVTRSKGEPYREDAVVLSQNGASALIESRDKNKIISREGYRTDAKGIWVTSVLSGKNPVPVSPPLPLLPLPIEEGKVVEWQGTIGAGKTTVTGRAWTRVTRREKVKTPAGEFLAYRVDMRTELGGGGQGATLMAARWFAPGVGIVRTRALDANTSLVKDLLPQKKGKSFATNGVK